MADAAWSAWMPAYANWHRLADEEVSGGCQVGAWLPYYRGIVPARMVPLPIMTDPAETTATATIEADLSGRELGDYRVLRRLGRGGMAEVYLAEQLSLRRQVALKVLRKSLAN